MLSTNKLESPMFFPSEQELTEYFNGKSEKCYVHLFNIATFFLKKDELFSLPTEQRKGFFDQKIKILPKVAQSFYYQNLTKLVEKGFLCQDGFCFQLVSNKPICNELYYLKQVLASGDIEQIKAASDYCEESVLTQATNFLTLTEKENLKALLSAIKQQEQKLVKKPTVTGNLTESQQKAFDEILAFCKQKSGDNRYKLIGYAGTGKSFLTAKIIKALKSEQICIACPTNKAANNISKFATENNLDVEITTIAKLLGLFPEIEIKDGKEVFVAKNESKISEFKYIFVDEYSMLNKENLNSLLDQLRLDQKVIFVGDNAQLPPVGESSPPVDSLDIPFSQLTEVLRYDGELIKVAESIRSSKEYNKKLYSYHTVKDESIDNLNRRDWCYKAAELIGSEEFKSNPLFARVLVWRNQTAEKINSAIRGIIFGKTCKNYEIGDLVIAKKPVFRKGLVQTKEGLKDEWMIVMQNSEEAQIVGEAIEQSETIKLFGKTYHFDYWSVPACTDSNLMLNLKFIINKDELESAKKEAKEFIFNSKGNKKDLWNDYQVLEKSFDECPFAYAITTHKSQGSTIDNVFVDVADLKGCPDLQKMQYTAITRTKSKLWIPQLN